MKREIKFRAWYGNKMIEVGQLDFFSNGQIHVNEELVGAILMQYTGLKDKNGKEIYEGDIVKQFGCPILFKIEFYKSAFLAQGIESSMRLWLHEPYGEIEIIGNIYENPELLTPTK